MHAYQKIHTITFCLTFEDTKKAANRSSKLESYIKKRFKL